MRNSFSVAMISGRLMRGVPATLRVKGMCRHLVSSALIPRRSCMSKVVHMCGGRVYSAVSGCGYDTFCRPSCIVTETCRGKNFWSTSWSMRSVFLSVSVGGFVLGVI